MVHPAGAGMFRYDLPRGLHTLAVLLLAILAAVLFSVAHARHPALPQSAQELGWFTWFDQERYYKAAIAWSKLKLDPALHWYLPGYSLLAAPFVYLLPLEPFFLPNLFFLLAALVLFSELSARLAPELPFARTIGAVIFFGCSVLSNTMLEVWVVPISSSATTPIIYLCLLLAVLFTYDPSRARLAFLAALTSCALVAFRPSDAMPILAAAGAGMGISLLTAAMPWRSSARVVIAALVGSVLSVGLVGVTYLSIYGFHESGYVWISRALGFEWRLIPLRWVQLFLDPRPALIDGEGLIHRFPWIVPGLAGCAVCVAAAGNRFQLCRELIVVGAIASHIALYCAYRDLHPPNLFRFGNYHYFKWVIPFLGLYALRLVSVLVFVQHRTRNAAVGVATLAALLPWRTELREFSFPPNRPVATETSIAFRADLSSVQNTVVLAGDQAEQDANLGKLWSQGKQLGFFDFRGFAQPGGMMLYLLRPAGEGDFRFETKPPVALSPGFTALLARQKITLGLPCAVRPERRSCLPIQVLPAAELAVGKVVPFDGSEKNYLVSGWSFPDGIGRWSDGTLSFLRFRLPESVDPRAPLALELEAHPYLPQNDGSLRLDIDVNGTFARTLQLDTRDLVQIRIPIPAQAIPTNRTLMVAIRISSPRQPYRFERQSKDRRLLGIHARKLRLLRDQS